MMRLIKILFAFLLVFIAVQVSAKKPKDGKAASVTVYAVGVATSFNDSIGYVTEIQELNDAQLDRNRYLHRRSGYSFQLRDYLVGLGKENYTSLELFNAKKAKLEKQLAKVRARCQKDEIKLVEVSEADFKFTKPEEL